MNTGDTPRDVAFRLPTGETVPLEALLISNRTLLIFLRHLA